jgi:hypothetical protein
MSLKPLLPMGENIHMSMIDDIAKSMLSLAKEGISKTELKARLGLSNQQLRRRSAELVDIGLLRLDQKRRVLVTSAKGLMFLNIK